MLAVYIALGVLGLLAAGFVAWRFFSKWNWYLYPIWLFHEFYTRLVWRARVSRPLPVDDDEGAVVICNHSCPVDPAFIALTTPRMVHWMVAKEYFSMPVIGWGLKALGCIPVSRGGVDTAATRMAIRHVQNKQLVGLLPEGRINTTDKLLIAGRPGAALVALRARAKVVPCFVRGAPYRGSLLGIFFMPAKVWLEVGDPVEMSDYYRRLDEGEPLKQLQMEVTKKFLKEIARLAGVEDFEPEIAGRKWKPGAEEVAENEAVNE